MEFLDEPPESPTVILVVADSNFINLCDDAHAYIQRLKTKIGEMRKNGAELYTVSGRYGVSNVDSSMPVIEVIDRNKTMFSQTLENSGMLYDELIAITVVAHDPYIDSAKEVVTAANKTFTHYGYLRK